MSKQTTSSTHTIEEILSKNTDLPSMPTAVLKVIRACNQTSIGAGEIAHVIAQDQALSARLLRMSNSAYYGLSKQVDDLQEAVMVLGMKNVRNLAMIAATYTWLGKPLTGYCLGPKQLWTHSFGVAVGSQFVAGCAKLKNQDQTFTAGLLHDIGKVALSIWLENKIVKVIEFAETMQIPFDEAERKMIGFDHTEIGEALATQWNLPDELVKTIRYHHHPNECEPHSNIVDAVHIGTYLTMSMGFGLGGDGLHYHFYEETLQRLNLKIEDLELITDHFVTAYEKYETMFEELA